jgi:hypothetical protein
MTAKKSRSDTILKCLRAVADYYGIEPTKVLDRNQMHPSKKAMAARDVMYYHLRECGMEYHAIGRIFGHREKRRIPWSLSPDGRGPIYDGEPATDRHGAAGTGEDLT